MSRQFLFILLDTAKITRYKVENSLEKILKSGGKKSVCLGTLEPKDWYGNESSG